MLRNHFFTVTGSSPEGAATTSQLWLNAHHAIFEGHFPGRPVVPGVCMLQMVKELTELAAGGPLQLVRADFMKFLRVIDPNHQSGLSITLTHSGEGQEITTGASITNDGVVCFKFKGVFRKLG